MLSGGHTKRRLNRLFREQQKDEVLRTFQNGSSLQPGHGNPTPSVVIVGALTTGHSEKTVHDTMSEVGIDQDDAWFTSAFKHGATGHFPTDEHLAQALFYMERELVILKPVVVVVMGQRELSVFTDEGTISTVHGAVWDWEDYWLIPAVHPSLILADPMLYAEYLLSDMAVVEQYIRKGRPHT